MTNYKHKETKNKLKTNGKANNKTKPKYYSKIQIKIQVKIKVRRGISLDCNGYRQPVLWIF
jgi:hypothetical protein